MIDKELTTKEHIEFAIQRTNKILNLQDRRTKSNIENHHLIPLKYQKHFGKSNYITRIDMTKNQRAYHLFTQRMIELFVPKNLFDGTKFMIKNGE